LAALAELHGANKKLQEYKFTPPERSPLPWLRLDGHEVRAEDLETSIEGR